MRDLSSDFAAGQERLRTRRTVSAYRLCRPLAGTFPQTVKLNFRLMIMSTCAGRRDLTEPRGDVAISRASSASPASTRRCTRTAARRAPRAPRARTRPCARRSFAVPSRIAPRPSRCNARPVPATSTDVTCCASRRGSCGTMRAASGGERSSPTVGARRTPTIFTAPAGGAATRAIARPFSASNTASPPSGT